MNKRIFLNGLKVLVTIGMLFGLTVPSAVQARIPIDISTQSVAVPELVKPVAVADIYTLDLGTATKLSVPAPGVLSNDYDPDGDPITATAATQPANGYVIMYTSGAFEYTPDPGFTGDDVFTYKAFDGTSSSTPAQVKITVTGGNTAPVANADVYATAVNTTLIVPPETGVLLNDYDADGDTLTAVKLGDPAHGTLMLSSNGGFTYIPELNYAGDDIFTYQAFDGITNSSPVQVTITVAGGGNTAPDANSDSYETDTNVQLVVDVLTGVLANDFDVDGDTLTAVLWVAPISGSAVLQPDGSFVYTPEPDYSGTANFTYKAFDGELYSDPCMVTITVNPTNTEPEAVADSYETPMNTTLTVEAPGVLTNDFDLDGDLLTAEITGSPIQFGIIYLNSNGSFTYIPDTDYVGTVYFTYQAYDGLVYSDPVQVTIEVTSDNTPPVALADSYVMLMNTTLTVGVEDGVLVNDSDIDGNPITAELLGVPVVNGTLSFFEDGSFTYDPNDDYFGTVYFTYWAFDGLEYSNPVLVTITVRESNLPPVAQADSYYTPATETLSVIVGEGVLANDSDPDGDTLEAQLVDGVDHGLLTLRADGSFTYVPEVSFVGVDYFRYLAFDGLTTSTEALVAITVGEEVNMAPVAVQDIYSMRMGQTLDVAIPGILVNDFDVNDDPITAQLVTTVSHGHLTFHTDGSFSYTPDAGFVGLDQYTYRVYDGELYSSTTTVTIKVFLVSFIPLLTK